MDAVFLGLDLAWSARNPSGLAVLAADGTVLEAGALALDDAALLAWTRERLAPRTLIGIDMPTIVRNPAGVRPCEAALGRDFRRAHAGPHPANLARFPDGGRARALLDALAADGVRERLDLEPGAPGRHALEVFPHPAHVRLFGRSAIFRYKKKTRPWPEVLDAWAEYRLALASLAFADPPLAMPAWIPQRVESRGYKAWDDTLDAITCAYVAAWFGRWGTAGPGASVYGDLADGYIAVPGAAILDRHD